MNNEQLLRYSRHLMLDEIDVAGQERLLAAKVLVVGCGGLGTAALPYLAAAGIGTLVIADHDTVELSNLQRQITYHSDQIGQSKAWLMQQYLHKLNPDIIIQAHAERLDAARIDALSADVDLILDCSDNFPTRQAINAASVAHKVPLLSAAAVRFVGQLGLFHPAKPHSPCYACLFGNQPFDDGHCATFGVFAPLVGIIGSAQAAAALRFLLGLDEKQIGVWHQYQGLHGRWQSFQGKRDGHCPVCSKHNNNSIKT